MAPARDVIGEALAAAPADYLASRWEASARRLEAAAREARSKEDPRLPRVALEWGRVLVELGRRNRAVGDQALVVLTALEESPAAQQDPVLRAAAMVQRGRVYYWRKLIQNEGEWERCHTLFREALALSEEHRGAKGQAEALFHVGLVYQLQMGLKRARPFFERSLAAAREAGDPLQQASAHRHLGFADEEAGQWDEALAHHQQALSLREQMKFSRGVMFQLSSVGHVLCVGKQDCAAAEPYFLRAAVLALELDEPLGEVEARMGLGRVAQARNEGLMARKQFDAALLAARRAGDLVSEAQVGLALSEVLAEAGQRAESLRALETAWELLVRSGQSHKSREVVNALIRLRGS